MILRQTKGWKFYFVNSSGRLALLKYLSIATLVGIVLLFVATTIVFAIFSVDVPDPSKVVRREGYSTIIYDRNGKVLYDVYKGENRIPLEFSDIPKYLQEATVAIEDKDFYTHKGIDPLSPFRIVRNAIFYGQLTGGSGLTQQLVKTVLLTNERTLTRKIKEAILASEIENKFSKDQILQMYLNEVPYGGSTYGVESASQKYFNKHAKDLNLVESAILAGLPQAPSIYSPYSSTPKAYVDRTKQVLKHMTDESYITKQQEVDAVKQLDSFQFASKSAGLKAPHFVFYIKDQLVKMFGEDAVEGAGLRVTTTLDLDQQEKVEQIVKDEILKIKKLKVGNGAAVVLNPKTGEITSMVGSYDYFATDYEGNYNVAINQRQPGSSGKPFIYAASLMRNYTAATALMDVKTDFPSGEVEHPIYTPQNYDGKFRGLVQTRFSLGNSLNIPAVKMTALVGVKDVMILGFNAGISTWEPTNENMKKVGLSLALGGREVQLLELTSAYGIFANEGVHIEPISILKVTDAKGKKLFEAHQPAGKKVISPEVAFLVSHILSDDNARKDTFGANSMLVIPGKTVAVKTGTTDQKRDNWTVGYTPYVVAGVWVGNNDNSAMDPKITSGVTGASPIWNKIMKVVTKDVTNQEFKKPDQVVSVEIDALTGGLPHNSSPKRVEYFVKGTEPLSQNQIYRKVKVSKNNGKLANSIEIKLGEYDEKEFMQILENDPVSLDGKNLWQDGINAWINDTQKDNSLYKIPTETSDAHQNDIIIRVESPGDKSKIETNNMAIKANAYTLRTTTKFKVEVDGTEKINKASDSINEVLDIFDGPHTLKFIAEDSAGNSSNVEIKIGVKTNWDYIVPTPSPTPTPTL